MKIHVQKCPLGTPALRAACVLPCFTLSNALAAEKCAFKSYVDVLCNYMDLKYQIQGRKFNFNYLKFKLVT